jgi:hypothetical protein
MTLNTRNKNIYGLWVGISTVFNILEHLRIKGEGSLRMVMTTYKWMLLDTKNKTVIIWFRGGDLKSFLQILEHFLFKGDGTTMYGNELHNIRCYFTQERRIYMYLV